MVGLLSKRKELEAVAETTKSLYQTGKLRLPSKGTVDQPGSNRHPRGTSEVSSTVRRGPVELSQAPSAASWSFWAGACFPAGSQVACGVHPAHRSPRVCSPVFSGGSPSSPPALSGTHGVHSATPKRAPVCAPPPVSGTISVCPRPPGPPDAIASSPQDPQVPALPGTPCAPPTLSLLRLGAARGRDPGEAQAPRPQVRRVTGRAGSSSRGRGHCRSGGRPRVRHGCPASLYTPGGRYLVGGHRTEALEDGQDVLLAGVPHGHQRNEALPARPTGKGRTGAVAASRR